MVQSGQFTLQIIKADDSREPMKEFTAPDGKVYVEAEPDLEYFVRIQADRPGAGVLTKCAIDIDGTSLGYDYRINSFRPSEDLGLWNYTDGKSDFLSLKFVLKRTRAIADPNAAASLTPPVGMIRAQFYECIKKEGETYIQEDVDSTKRLPSESSHNNSSNDDFSAMAQTTGKKAFASVAGSTTGKRKTESDASGDAPAVKKSSKKVKSEKPKKPVVQQRYVRGSFLGEVTVNYTSAMGFIQLGII